MAGEVYCKELSEEEEEEWLCPTTEGVHALGCFFVLLLFVMILVR
jgi:hypothetical protein